jgi:vacuolar-type H+-ATPase subunit H
MTEFDVIRHLLEQEERTTSLVRDAQIESDRRLAAARAEADALYAQRYSEALRELEAGYAARKTALATGYMKKGVEYRSRLNAQAKSYKNFNKYLGPLLAGAA